MAEEVRREAAAKVQLSGNVTSKNTVTQRGLLLSKGPNPPAQPFLEGLTNGPPLFSCPVVVVNIVSSVHKAGLTKRDEVTGFSLRPWITRFSGVRTNLEGLWRTGGSTPNPEFLT